MKYRPLQWMDLPVGDASVPVFLSCAALTPELEGNIGVTLGDHSPRTIYIDAAQTKEEQDVTVAHEYFHALLWGKNGLHWRTEERIVQTLSFVGRQTWKWRRRPKGAEALAAYARRA